MAKINASLPSLNMVTKVAISVFVIMLLVRLSPDSWGLKKWFSPTA